MPLHLGHFPVSNVLTGGSKVFTSPQPVHIQRGARISLIAASCGCLRDGHGRHVYRRALSSDFDSSSPPQFRQDWAMCGRYRLTNAERYADLNDVRLGGQEIPARFNIAPTQTVFVVLDESPKEFFPC